MMCALGAKAANAYACFTSADSTLTFFYDSYSSSRPGQVFDLVAGDQLPAWGYSSISNQVAHVAFDPSFASARPLSTYKWFDNMPNLRTIQGLNYLNTSEVTNMAWMFSNCKYLTSIDVSQFNTAKVTNMSGMFSGCTGLTSLDVCNFNTAKVTDMSQMFGNSYLLKTIYVDSGWSTVAVANSTGMFTNCTSLVGGKGTVYNSSHTDMDYAHIDGGTNNPGYFTDINAPVAYACYYPSSTSLSFYYDTLRSLRSGTTYDLNTDNNMPDWLNDGTAASVTTVAFDPSFSNVRPKTTAYWFAGMTNLTTLLGYGYLNTNEVTNMNWMFGACSSLTSLNVRNFNTSNVTTMASMFYGCSGLTSLDLSKFDTSNVTDMSAMFYGCSWLETIDLSSFNTASLVGSYTMFYGCNHLQTIYAGSGWSTASIAISSNMFFGCFGIVGGQGTTYDENHTDKAYARIDGGSSNPGYFTGKFEFLRGDVNDDGSVSIGDVTALIDYLLSGDGSGVNVAAADCNNDNGVSIGDVTALIDFLLSGTWD